THTQSLLLLGIAYLREGLPSSYANAYSVFKRLILHKGDQPEYYFFLGLTCQKTGRLQEAYEAYQKALGIRQDFLEAQINFHGLASNYPSWKGLIDFEKNLADHPVMLANLAVLYQRMGYPKVADSLFSKAINLASNQDVRTMISELSKEAKNGK
ncbi:MAG: tetratricopeptide repeat protein, partial [Planctomycetota bacterium]